MFVLTEHIAMRRPENVRPIYLEIASISHFLHFVWAAGNNFVCAGNKQNQENLRNLAIYRFCVQIL